MVRYKSNLKNVKSAMNNANKVMLMAIGKSARGFVQAVTPVAEPHGGSLKDSITYQADKDGVWIGSDMTSEDYPIYVHMGTYKMAARPYIKDGVLGNLSQLKSIAERNYKL